MRIFLLLLVSFAQSAIAESDESAAVVRIGEINGKVSIAPYAALAQMPASEADAYQADPLGHLVATALASSRLLADSPTGVVELENPPGQLAWERNPGGKVILDAPSRFNWVAVDIVNDSPARQDLMLELFATGAPGFAWYYEDGDGDVHSHVDLFQEPGAARPVFDARPIVPMTLEPGEQVRLVINVWSQAAITQLSMDLWEEESFRESRIGQYLLDGIYFGLVGATILYSLVMFIAIRQYAYLYFALFLLSSCGVIYVGSGTATLFGFHAHLSLAISFYVACLIMLGAFSALFSIHLLDVKHTHPTLYRYWMLLVYLNIPLLLTSLSLVYTGEVARFAIFFLTGSALLMTIAGQLLNVYALVYYWHRRTVARYWFLGITLHSVSIMVWAALINSTVEFAFHPRYFAQLSTLVDTLILASVIAYTYRSEAAARLAAQENALASLRLARDIERAKTNFVSTVGHDLHGPIRAISHFAEALKPEIGKGSADKLDKINDNLSLVERLLDNMVKLSRTEYQGAGAQRRPVALAGLFAELNNQFTQLAAAKNITLEFRATDAVVITDYMSLHQVLRNLVENAIKYTEEGYVRVGIERAQEGDEHLVLYVEDSGVGISVEDEAKIFDEFYQVDADEADGVGLGLSIVSRLCRLLDIPFSINS